MTRAPTHDAGRSGAILSRLLVVLALVLFVLPQGHAGGLAATADPAAQGTVERTLSLPSAQRLMPRAQLANDSAPDAVVPDAAGPAWPSRTAATISPAPHQSFLPVGIRILPPVRGPPAA